MKSPELWTLHYGLVLKYWSLKVDKREGRKRDGWIMTLTLYKPLCQNFYFWIYLKNIFSWFSDILICKYHLDDIWILFTTQMINHTCSGFSLHYVSLWNGIQWFKCNFLWQQIVDVHVKSLSLKFGLFWFCTKLCTIMFIAIWKCFTDFYGANFHRFLLEVVNWCKLTINWAAWET